MNQFFSLERMAAKARQAAADGCVLLENRNKTLPLRKGDRIALFGRIAFDYYKSGLGSGGLVNTKYVTGIDDALKAEKSIVLDQELLAVYPGGERKIRMTMDRAGDRFLGRRKKCRLLTIWSVQLLRGMMRRL